jgi:4-diphosphocytidyl-2-C-methyl-D-erythritol kinase
MGAGSADAAFVLGALQRLCAPTAQGRAMAAAAREVGADVGFFLIGGTAIGRGRGDELEPLPPPSSPLVFLVVLPPLSIATAAAYLKVDLIAPRRLVSSFVEGMREPGAVRGALGAGFNRLESAAIRVEPALGLALSRLRETTNRPWVMTGSGSALFAPMANEEDAANVGRSLLRGPACDVRVVRSFERHPGSP